VEPPLEAKPPSPPSPPPAHRSWWQRLLVDGPDPVDPNRPEDAGALDTLLTWPVRWLAVVGALVVGRIWAHSAAGVQLGWALQYSLLVAVSIVSSVWLPVLVVNLISALAWLYVSWRPPRQQQPNAPGFDASDVVTWVNRQIGHGEAIITWVTVALVSGHGLIFQLVGVAAVVFVGPPAINWLTRRNFIGGAVARRSRADLMMERRLVIYGATLLGIILLGAKAPHQKAGLIPLLATVLPAIAVRCGRYFRRRSHERRAALAAATPESAAANNPVREVRKQKVERQRRVDSVVGWVGPAIVVGSIVVLAGLSLWQTGRLAQARLEEQDGPPPPSDACAAEAGGPAVPTIAMLVLADTQLHELGGKRFPGQMEVASALVPVCRRPVELDMLSTAAVVRYQTVYEELAAARRKAGLAPPWWAHLGDFADLSCADEMTRMLNLLKNAYGGEKEPNLAGVAPGNHDSTFQGNFAWSPYWDGACRKRLDKAASDTQLAGLLAKRLPHGAETKAVRASFPQSLVHAFTPPGRYTVTRLGTLPGNAGRPTRGVLGVFIDTSDQLAEDYGIAGTNGTFSGTQREQIQSAIRGQETDGAWSDPWFVVFGHIPYGELTSASQKEVQALITALDDGGCQARGPDCTHTRVIALVTAHTHFAESHRRCMGHRLVREIVVGSVIDPPQQAALLEVGLDARGRGVARLSTMPAVARAGFTCSADYAIPAKACVETIAQLAQAPRCRDLVAGIDRDEQPTQSCDDLTRPMSLAEQIDGIARRGGPTDPEELRYGEEIRARSLVRCVCRDPLPEGAGLLCASALRAPLDDEAYGAVIEALARDEKHQTEMTCLAWAASVVQQHKAAGMTMSDALHCAFVDPTLPPAQVTVAAAKDVPCY
jgi:hypothetical protein